MSTYPMIWRIITSLGFLACAVSVSWYPIRILTLVTGVIVFSTIFRKIGVILVIVILVVAIPLLLLHNFIDRIWDFSFMKVPWDFSSLRMDSKRVITVYPDTKLDLKDINSVEIRTTTAKIVFTDSEYIEYPSEMKMELSNGSLTLVGEEKRKKYVVMFGTNGIFKNIRLDSVGLSIKGEMVGEVEHLKVDSVGLSIVGTIRSRDIVIDGTGLNLVGRMIADFARISGTGMDLKLRLEGVKSMSVDGTGISGELIYEDSWEGKRYLKVDGTGGKLNIRLPRNNPGKLEIEKSGAFLIVEKERR